MSELSCPHCGAVLELAAQVSSVAPHPHGMRDPLARYNLTTAERKYAHRVLNGLTNREIAAETGTSQQVVKNYMTRIYDKVGCSNRTEFCVMVLAGGASGSPES